MSCFRDLDTGDKTIVGVPADHEWKLIGMRSTLSGAAKIWHCRHCGITIEVLGEQAFGVTAP